MAHVNFWHAFASFCVVQYFARALMINTEQFTTGLLLSGYETNVLVKSHVFGIAQCARVCIHHLCCESAIFDRQELSCTLMTSSAETLGGTVRVAGKLQTELALVPRSVTPSDCADRLCPPRHVCVVLSSLTTVCMVSECPSFSHELYNGTYEFTRGSLVGSLVVFTCDTGFTLNGSASIICNGQGNWTGQPPTCDIVDCHEPQTDIPGATLTEGATTYPTTRTLVCPPGSAPDGPLNTTTCQAGGNWSNLDVTCKVSCGEPPLVQNATVNNGGTLENDTTTYTCNPGLYMIGPTKITCSKSGQWDPLPGICRISCGEPPLVQNATVNNGGTLENDTTTYTCNPGLYMIGPTKITCSKSGQWDPLPGICRNCLPDYDPKGQQYNGYLNVTRTGVACQPWTLSSVYKGIWDQSNYCRNPDADVKPWCPLGIQTTRLLFDYCDINPC